MVHPGWGTWEADQRTIGNRGRCTTSFTGRWCSPEGPPNLIAATNSCGRGRSLGGVGASGEGWFRADRPRGRLWATHAMGRPRAGEWLSRTGQVHRRDRGLLLRRTCPPKVVSGDSRAGRAGEGYPARSNASLTPIRSTGNNCHASGGEGFGSAIKPWSNPGPRPVSGREAASAPAGLAEVGWSSPDGLPCGPHFPATSGDAVATTAAVGIRARNWPPGRFTYSCASDCRL